MSVGSFIEFWGGVEQEGEPKVKPCQDRGSGTIENVRGGFNTSSSDGSHVDSMPDLLLCSGV